MGDMELDDSKKPHRKRQAGRKYDKKKSKDDAEKKVEKPKNLKAFAFHSIKKTERAVRRTADVQEKKMHNPVVDRASAIPPPVVVAVVGPPKVGKSTLIHCLVRSFVKRKVSSINGPITVVSSKKQRITFIECNNDLNSMIDVAKVADLVIVMIDASFGFEMEVFEFLHILKAHGQTQILGVLTHLDAFENNKKLKKTKTILKKRFWKDVYAGAKLFYLSGMINQEYQKTEIHNLGRFISIMKYRPLQWKTTHPYVLVDRMEDVTNPEEKRKNEKVDRTICLYGYVRGTHFKNKSGIHIPGIGDHQVDDMSFLPDPCPLPDELKKRSLDLRERLIYAPFSGVGGVLFDKDAVYIETKGSHALKQNRRAKDEDELFTSLKSNQATIDDKMASTNFNLFDKDVSDDNEEEGDDDDEANSDEDQGDDDEANSDGDEGDNDAANSDEDDKKPWKETSYGENDEEDDDNEEEMDVDEEDDDEEDDDEEEDDEEDDEEEEKTIDGKLRWKTQLEQNGINSFLERLKNVNNIQHFVYGKDILLPEKEKECEDKKKDDEDAFGGLFSVMKDARDATYKFRNQTETSIVKINQEHYGEDDVDKLLNQVTDCFVTGTWGEDEDAETLLKKDNAIRNTEHDDYDDEDGDIDDCEGDDAISGEEDGEEESDGESSIGDHEKETPEEKRARRMQAKLLERKKRQKQMFDDDYDDDKSGGKNNFETLKDEMAQQAQLNRSEFESMSEEARTEFEGFRPGLYVRIQVKGFPCEFVENFDPNYPVIVGGLLFSEQNVGYVTASLKKHKWRKRPLKTNDPVILSIGWRRFQTIPVYSIRDHNDRNRQIKYTPDHKHCNATFWGPITPQGTGVIAVDTLRSDVKEFRISAIGVVCELDKVFTVVKKLKLVGTPFLIHRNTAFIQGMFTSPLEVSKFELAKIKTVSNIRGQVKKSIQNGSTLFQKYKQRMTSPVTPGSFRATFEFPIKMSDIVFMTTWCKTTVSQFYNPVTNLVMPMEIRNAWRGMKTLGELKRERGIRFEPKEDSLYKPIERKTREPAPLRISKGLQKQLPFQFKTKTPGKVVGTYKGVAVIRDPAERKREQTINQIKKMYDLKRKQKRAEMRKRAAVHQKQFEVSNDKKSKKKWKK